jgi:hypothetical protein
MNVSYCYVEFSAKPGEVLDRLASLLAQMQRDRKADQILEKEWLTYFQDAELDCFWWPNAMQLAETQSRWGDVPMIRLSPNLENEQRDWDIYSMFEVIAQSEYELLDGLKTIAPATVHLAFQPEAYPYGGTESLQKLVTAFGFPIIAVDDGTGRVEFGR